MERLDGARQLLRFDEFLVDPQARLLQRDGEPVPLTPKVFAVLLALLEKPGQVVPKDELLRKVWSDTVVTEANLTQSISTLRKALGESAHERRYVVTVPGVGYSFAARVETLEMVEEAPEASQAPETEPAVPAPVPRRGRWRFELLSAVLILATLAAWLTLIRTPRAPEEVSSGNGHRRSVAVLGFRNLSGRSDAQWLAQALPEMLTTELATAKELRVIPGENVARARLTGEAGDLDRDDLERAHDVLGSDLVVVGSYLKLEGKSGDRLRLDLRVLQTPGGETQASLAELGTEPELFELVSRAGARLRGALGVSTLAPQQARAVRALLPASPQATRLYAAGLARLRSFDASGARDLLEEAARADPTSAVIRSALSQSWAALGHDAQALQDARRAVDLARSLPRTDRLAIQARLHVASREWDRASEVYRSLWTFYPDDLEYGLQLVAALSEAGHGAEALATVAELRRLPEPGRGDPRIDLAEAIAAQRLGDLATMQRAATAAAEKARKTGADLVLAQALVQQAEALVRLGHPQQGLALTRQAIERFEAAGDQMGVVSALTLVGIALREQGDLDGAEASYRRALGIAERLGNLTGIALQRSNLGVIYHYRGDLRQARESLALGRSLYARAGDRVLEARTLCFLGAVLWAQGDLAQAQKAFEQSLEMSQATGNRRDQARALSAMGMALARQGRLSQGRRRFEQALAILQSTGDSSLASSSMAASAEILLHQGALPAARQRLDQALAAKRQARDRLGAGDVLSSLAGLDLASGDLAAAGPLIEELLRNARALGARALEVKGLRRQGELQAAKGDLEPARLSLDQALRASLQMGEGPESADLRLDLADLALAQRRFEEAERLSRQAAGWYGARGLAGFEGYAWALLADALVRRGRTREAQEAAARAQAKLAGLEDRELALKAAPHLARALAGQGPQALQELARAVEEARRLGFVTTWRELQKAGKDLQDP
ncbi:MAG TPA: tetratricopeptide repeat protein [Thermoanaerobaculia bacterium]|nr:tetratricopeptide repeat protein [Thermoanaerobaculia bacterium]